MPYFKDKKRGDTMQKESNPLRLSFLKAAAGSRLAVQILDPSAAPT
jgi:hypothetical protein